MEKENYLNISLLELVEFNLGVSIRLRNCINVAMDDGEFPIRTVGDFLRFGGDYKKEFMKVPNMGRKTLFELEYLIDDVVKNCGLLEADISDEIQVLNENREKRKEYSDYTLLDVVHSCDVSVRLRHCIEEIDKDVSFPIKTVADYLLAGKKGKEVLIKVKNMGRLTAEELDAQINNVIGSTNFCSTDERLKHVLSFPEALRNLRISEAVSSDLNTLKYEDIIKKAEEDGEISYQSVGEYYIAGSEALNDLKSLQGIGALKAGEIDKTIRNLFANEDIEEGFSRYEYDVRKNRGLASVAEILIDKLKSKLNKREFEVLKYRAVEDKTLEEAGVVIGVTRERIRQIEKKAITKINRVYEKALFEIAKKIDEVLDESYGEVGLIDGAKSIGLEPDAFKLFVYLSVCHLKEKVRIKGERVQRLIMETEHSEWNEEIDNALFSMNWPISLTDLEQKVADIPNFYLHRYLVKRKGADISDDIIVGLSKIPQTVRIAYVLRNAGRQLHASEIARRYGQMFGQKISEHCAQSTASRMEEALIVDRGVYSLYELLNLTENQIAKIRSLSFEYLNKEEKFVSSKVIFNQLFENKPEWESLSNAYVVHGILQDDSRFVIKRGLMVGIESHSHKVRFKSLNDEVIDTVWEFGPISVSRIKEIISDRRKVLSIGITQILDRSDKIIKISPGLYDSVDKVFDNSKLLSLIKLGIKVSLIDHEQGLYELTNKLRSVKSFDSIKISQSLVDGLLKSMNGVEKEGSIIRLVSQDSVFDIYNGIINRGLREGDKRSKIIEMVEIEVGSKIGMRLIEVDHRMQTANFGSSNSNVNSQDYELGSILSAFEV